MKTAVAFALALIATSLAYSKAGEAAKRSAKVENETSDADQFEELVSILKRMAPAGWSVEGHSSSGTDRNLRNPSRPSIEIRSIEPMRVEWPVAPNPDEGAVKPDVRIEPFVIQLHAVPIVSSDEHARLHKQNEEKHRKRLDFEQKRLKNVQYGFMGGRPFPPQHYEPSNADEKRTLLEYSFLWLATEPMKLPSHSYQSLSFDVSGSLRVTVVDDHERREVQDLVKELEKIVRPYVAGESLMPLQIDEASNRSNE